MSKKDIVKAIPKPEKKVNQKLVDEAFDTIQELYRNHHTDYLIAVAEYLAETFFDGDPERMVKRRPVKKMSFNALCDRLIEEDKNLPKKSWLYSAVNVIADQKKIKDSASMEVFQTYINLSPSAKVELTRIKDAEKKYELIKATEKNKLSVRDLRRKVSEVKANARGKTNKEKVSEVLTPYKKELDIIQELLKKRRTQVKRAITKGGNEVEKFTKLENLLNDFMKQLEEMGV